MSVKSPLLLSLQKWYLGHQMFPVRFLLLFSVPPYKDANVGLTNTLSFFLSAFPTFLTTHFSPQNQVFCLFHWKTHFI